MKRPEWLKEKGYVHLSPSLELGRDWLDVVKKVTCKEYVARYAFYPLIHTNLSDRKFKKGNASKFTTDSRKHTHYRKHTNHVVRNAKSRPLHYASHMDAVVYSYYGYCLKNKYEAILKGNETLNDAVIAYRKIATFEGSKKGKSNIHFAKECFDEIKSRAQLDQEVAVLAIDLKSFFSSLDHKMLKTQWAKLLKKDELPADHYNVFRSCTNFKYVLLDDLRIRKKKSGRKAPFDESKLSKIRKHNGFKCFFESNEDFRNHIRDGRLSVYENPFRGKLSNGKKVKKGIPQGLAVSAILANIYLLDFDLDIINRWVEMHNVYYRRYSDDIFLICDSTLCDSIEEDIAQLVKKYSVDISKDKTERFVFRNVEIKHGEKRLECFKRKADGQEVPAAMSYLGFEFRGHHVGIKSANLAKYYRKIIATAKRKSSRALKLIEENPYAKKAVFKNQLKKIYNLPLKFNNDSSNENMFKRKKRYKLVLNDRGFYEFTFTDRDTKKQANYHSYIKRCCKEFGCQSFQTQIGKSKSIANAAISKYLKKGLQP